MTKGAAAVLRAVQSAPPGQYADQMSSMNVTVQQFGQTYADMQARRSQAMNQFGENDERTRAAHKAAILAEYQWNGARAAQQASSEQDVQAIESPQAIAIRENQGAEAYRAEADQFKAELEKLQRMYKDPNDPRVASVREQMETAEKRAKEAADRAKRAQAVADGKPLSALKKPTSR